MTTTKKKNGVSQGEVPSADENVEAGQISTDLDHKPVAVLPLHRAEDTVQRSATGRVGPRGKKLAEQTRGRFASAVAGK